MAHNPLAQRQNLLYFLLSIVVLAGIQLLGLHETYSFTFTDTSIDAAISWLLLGVWMLGVVNTLSFYHPEKGRLLIVVILPLLLSWLWLMLSTAGINWLVKSEEYLTFVEASQFYRFTTAYLLLAAGSGFSLMWYRLGDKEDAQRRKEESERMAREAELYKLRQQLQPHFLFNSLNSINSLIGSRPERARNMVEQLSDFLRSTLKRDEKQLISLREELESLMLYLEIEQVRFGHRLKVETECDEGLQERKIPPLILQPILENAIKFGLYGTTGEVVISMNCKEDGNLLHISISNPFDPDVQARSGTGFGLKSVKRRLYLLFARTDLLALKPENDKFTVELKIPKVHEGTGN